MVKRKRNHSEPDNFSPKQLEFDANEEERASTIFDLNDDCLTEVLCYLSESDLVNVCATDSRLRYASESAFLRNFAKLQTIVSTVRGLQRNAAELNYSLRLHHGHLMTKLLVMFKMENVGKILESLVENCGENINELEFCHFGVIVAKKALYNRGLKKMNLFLGGLSEKFPNLRHLKLEYRNRSELCPYLKFLLQPIPSLRSFSVSGASFLLEDVQQFIRLNGQLECLSLVGLTIDDWIRGSLRISKQFINDVNAALPQLNSVEFSCVHVTTPNAGYNANQFKNVRKLSIGHFAKFTTFGADQLSFAGENIEEIRGYLIVTGYLYDHLRDFAESISQFKQLRRLDLHLLIRHSVHIAGQANLLLLESLRIISNNNQLMEVVVKLFSDDKNFESTALLAGHQYYKTIGSAFIASQWNVNEDSSHVVFTKDH